MTKTFKSLFVNGIEMLFSAETQIAKALPDISKAVFTKELAQLLNEQIKRPKRPRERCTKPS